MHPDFPVHLYAAQVADPQRYPVEAPMSFTSVKEIDSCYPQLSWKTLHKVWYYEHHEEPRRNTCDVCKGGLVVYGFAAQMSRAMVARACLSCRVRYLEPVTRSELHDRLVEWGFSDFKMGLGTADMSGRTVQGSGEPSSADEAKRQLLEDMLPSSMKGGHLG
jgi:hypothetical protein